MIFITTGIFSWIKGHCSNSLRPLFFSLIDLCNAHLPVVPEVTFFDRGRMADGQQMGIWPCLVVQIGAQAEAVRDCQFVLTACGLQYCVWHSNQRSELILRCSRCWSLWLVNGQRQTIRVWAPSGSEKALQRKCLFFFTLC